jgi:hypothetical protein
LPGYRVARLPGWLFAAAGHKGGQGEDDDKAAHLAP